MKFIGRILVLGVGLLQAPPVSATSCIAEFADANWYAVTNKIIDSAGVGSLPSQDRLCWLTKNVNEGRPSSEYLLGMEYLRKDSGGNQSMKGALLVKSAADRGDTFAQAVTALNYLEGVGVTKNPAKAYEYAGTSALLGDAYGQYVFGAVIEGNRSLPFASALAWYQRAADRGIRLAKEELAHHSKQDSRGLSIEAGKATRDGESFLVFFDSTACPIQTLPTGEGKYPALAKCLKLAAKRGDITAQTRLGQMYLSGVIESRNDASARFWLEKAAGKNGALAHWDLGRMYQNGWGVPKHGVTAVKHYELAAEMGEVRAPMRLHALYAEGALIERDGNASDYWLEKAAEAGAYSAQLAIAKKLVDSGSIPAACPKIFNYLSSCKDVLPEAETLLGTLSLRGICSAEDASSAFRSFQLAANRGDALGMANLATLYFHGEGTQKDLKASADWFHKALSATRGLTTDDLTTVYSFLGHIYLQGEGFKDSGLATEFLAKAAAGGNQSAIDALKNQIEHSSSKWLDIAIDVLGAILALCLVVAVGIRVTQAYRLRTTREMRKTGTGLLERIPAGLRAQVINEAPPAFLAKRIWRLPLSLRRRLVAGVSEDVFEETVLSKLSEEELALLFNDVKLDVQDEILSALSPNDQKELLRSIPSSLLKYILAALPSNEKRQIELELQGVIETGSNVRQFSSRAKPGSKP